MKLSCTFLSATLESWAKVPFRYMSRTNYVDQAARHLVEADSDRQSFHFTICYSNVLVFL